MSRRTLTIIDTTSEMREINLDRIGKRELLLGRNAEQCEVVLADPIISKVQGKFLMKKDSVAYEDQDSSNGTFVANMGENRLLSKKDGYVELSDKSVLRIGNIHQPLINDPEYPESADYVIMESTYGDRSHGPKPDYVPELAKIIQETLDRGGNLVIPSFAVGRTQEMLYFIREIKAEHLVHGHGEFPVYVDSPLAVEATNIFRDHQKECYDSDAAALLAQGINPILFPGLKLSITSDESKAINFNETPKVIISASGMCDAGRIKHHLKHNLWRQESTVLFVGYQAVGTLGRALIGGAKEVKLFQEEVHVNAHIIQFPGMSGHADQEGLLKWAGSLRAKPDRVFVTHGEDKVTEIFAEKLWDEFRYPAMAPFSGTVFDLKENEFIEKTVGIPIQKETTANAGTLRTRSSGNAVFDRLVAAGQRLLTVITRNKGGANKDLSKFADQINSLCDKWDR